MRKHKILLVLAIAFLFGMQAMAQEKVILNSGNFSGVKSNSGIDIYLIESDSNTVSVSPADFNIKHLKISVKNDIVIITVNGKVDNDVKIILRAPEFKTINIGGATDVKTEGVLSGNLLSLNNSGASDAKLNLNYHIVKIKSSGASDVKLSGKVDSIYANFSGASDLKAFELTNTYAKIKASGASDIQLNTDSMIIADISGASSIKYKKEPAHQEIQASGAATTNEPRTTWVEANGNEFSVEEGEDTTRIKFNNNELIVIEDGENTRVLKRKIEPTKRKRKPKFTGNWAGLEFGVNGYMTPGFSLDLPAEYQFLELNYAKSTNFNINFFQQSINLISNKFGLVTGMGIQWNNYRFYQKNTVLTSDSGSISGYYDQTAGRSYTKSKLTSTYLVVPVILEFQTNGKHNTNSFHISAGVIGGVRLSSHTKQVYNFNGTGKNKPKTYDEFFLQPFRLDATARIGWGPINIYANYALTEMFRKGRGPELYPFTVGLVLPFS